MQDAPFEPRTRAVAEMERDEDEYDGGGERRAREGGQLCARARYQRDAARASRAEGESIGWDGARELKPMAAASFTPLRAVSCARAPSSAMRPALP